MIKRIGLLTCLLILGLFGNSQVGGRCLVCPAPLSGVPSGWCLKDSAGFAVWQPCDSGTVGTGTPTQVTYFGNDGYITGGPEFTRTDTSTYAGVTIGSSKRALQINNDILGIGALAGSYNTYIDTVTGQFSWAGSGDETGLGASAASASLFAIDGNTFDRSGFQAFYSADSNSHIADGSVYNGSTIARMRLTKNGTTINWNNAIFQTGIVSDVYGTHIGCYTPSFAEHFEAVVKNDTFMFLHDIDAVERIAYFLVDTTHAYFTGNLGIGIVTPTASLHVNGSVRIVNGSQGVGKVLTSDANGNATWQSPANGVLPPASTPTYIGQIYVDTLLKKLYFATGTSSSADWTIAN